ncbi:MAG TPA: ABC-F family ATP-binding cassette domain-containing protein [Myxococcota bacterium]
MLAVRNLRFAHSSKPILDDATIVFDDTDRTALVGDNGAGKSTLMNILAGRLKADSGTIERGRGQTLSFLSQEPQLDLNLSARDAVSLSGREFWEVDEALSRLNVTDPDKKVGDMSGGQRRRVDLARVLLEQSDILMLDEPTNHLDRQAIAYVVERVRRWSGPVIVISHDRAFLDDLCTRVVELSRGKLHSYAPPADAATTLTTSFIEQKLVRDDVMVKTQHKKERLWVRELAWLRAGTPARTTKQTARIDRAGELQDFVETEAAAIRQKQKTATLESQQLKRLGKTIIECQKLAIDRGGKRLFNNLDLVVTKGQRWGVVGENGAGKTSFLLAIQTACKRPLPENEIVLPASGNLIVGENTKIAVFDQHRAQLNPEATLDETLAADNDYVFFGEQRIHVSSWLERFLFDGSDRKRRVKTLSGGEQNRLVLSKLFLGDANVLLLDEPTNDLDVTTLGVLEEALLEHQGCAFIISHDRRFLDRVVTGVLAFEKVADDVPAVVTPVIGDWTHYERTQNARLAALKGGGITGTVTTTTTAKKVDASAAAAVVAAQQAAIDRSKRKRTNKEEREFKAMEETIQMKETRRDELNVRVQAPDVTRDTFKLKEISEDLARVEADIERLYARWEELGNLLPQ